jgi:TldD protein
MRMIKIFIAAMMLLGLTNLHAEKTLILDAAKTELDRAMKELGNEENKPYFISYGITDIQEYRVSASFGAIITDQSTHERILDIDLRVGDYNLDNTHIIRGQPFSFSFGSATTFLPIEDDPDALRSAIWYATDKNYKNAIERYEKVLTNKAVKVEEEDKSPDFSREEPNKYIEDIKDIDVNKDKWAETVRKLSNMFNEKDWLYIGDVSFRFELVRKYFVSSEGAMLQWQEPFARMAIVAKTKADDGMSLPLYETYFAFSPDELPDEASLANKVKEIMSMLEAQRKAPLFTDTYSGPAILSGEASGVLFHEIFGHRIEGHRLKDPNNAQTYKESVGEEVLPEFINVYMDPTVKELRGHDVSGYYMFDDQGVKGKKVNVVENGILKDFLMSRSPIEGFPKSNGHGRKEAGRSAVSRQSNLIVAADETVSVSELKEQLRKQIKEQGKDFGLYFDKVQGGFTFTGRSIPNSFNVNPIIVYKVYADGRPDELVRGVDLIGTPLTTFSNIIGAADDIGVFNGMCGAESGSVPVSASSPSLLVSTIEVQRKQKSQAKPPILESPASINNQ